MGESTVALRRELNVTPTFDECSCPVVCRKAINNWNDISCKIIPKGSLQTFPLSLNKLIICAISLPPAFLYWLSRSRTDVVEQYWNKKQWLDRINAQSYLHEAALNSVFFSETVTRQISLWLVMGTRDGWRTLCMRSCINLCGDDAHLLPWLHALANFASMNFCMRE